MDRYMVRAAWDLAMDRYMVRAARDRALDITMDRAMGLAFTVDHVFPEL